MLSDFFLAGDESLGVDSEEKRTVLGTRECGAEPASVQIVLAQGTRTQVVSTDADGKLRLAGTELTFLAVSADPIVLQSEDAEEVVVPMDSQWLAGWVIEHGDKAAHKRFLKVFAGRPGADRVRAAVTRRRSDDRQRRRAEAAKALKEARRSVGRREYDDALVLYTLGCTGLLQRVWFEASVHLKDSSGW